MTDCAHLVAAAHMHRDADGRRLWTCSGCGVLAEWGPTWSYFGNYECKKCQAPAIEWVACSAACAALRPAEPGPPAESAEALRLADELRGLREDIRLAKASLAELTAEERQARALLRRARKRDEDQS